MGANPGEPLGGERPRELSLTNWWVGLVRPLGRSGAPSSMLVGSHPHFYPGANYNPTKTPPRWASPQLRMLKAGLPTWSGPRHLCSYLAR